MQTSTNDTIYDPCPGQHRLSMGPPKTRRYPDLQELQEEEEECTDRQSPLEWNIAAEGKTNSLIVGPYLPDKVKTWFEIKTPEQQGYCWWQLINIGN